MSDIPTRPEPAAAPETRPLRPALLRGWRRRCPCCGKGPMMQGYLKVRPTCAVCGERLGGHKADDGPAYLTILIVGHALGPAMVWVFAEFRPEPLVFASVFVTGAVAMSLYLLPRMKGVVVAFQWAKRLYGFARA
ncbi:MAG: DUF983 domain-containing protein [Pseudomonadota bacterium]